MKRTHLGPGTKRMSRQSTTSTSEHAIGNAPRGRPTMSQETTIK